MTVSLKSCDLHFGETFLFTRKWETVNDHFGKSLIRNRGEVPLFKKGSGGGAAH
jgi:hypothetical protein